MEEVVFIHVEDWALKLSLCLGAFRHDYACLLLHNCFRDASVWYTSVITAIDNNKS